MSRVSNVKKKPTVKKSAFFDKKKARVESPPTVTARFFLSRRRPISSPARRWSPAEPAGDPRDRHGGLWSGQAWSGSADTDANAVTGSAPDPGRPGRRTRNAPSRPLPLELAGAVGLSSARAPHPRGDVRRLVQVGEGVRAARVRRAAAWGRLRRRRCGGVEALLPLYKVKRGGGGGGGQ